MLCVYLQRLLYSCTIPPPSDDVFDGQAICEIYMPRDPRHFFGRTVSHMGIDEYVRRIISYSGINDRIIGCALVYIIKLAKTVCICDRSVHRIVAVAILLAKKYNQDKAVSMTRTSRITGMPIGELTRLELCALQTLEWELFISLELFNVTMCEAMTIEDVRSYDD